MSNPNAPPRPSAGADSKSNPLSLTPESDQVFADHLSHGPAGEAPTPQPCHNKPHTKSSPSPNRGSDRSCRPPPWSALGTTESPPLIKRTDCDAEKADMEAVFAAERAQWLETIQKNGNEIDKLRSTIDKLRGDNFALRGENGTLKEATEYLDGRIHTLENEKQAQAALSHIPGKAAPEFTPECMLQNKGKGKATEEETDWQKDMECSGCRQWEEAYNDQKAWYQMQTTLAEEAYDILQVENQERKEEIERLKAAIEASKMKQEEHAQLEDRVKRAEALNTQRKDELETAKWMARNVLRLAKKMLDDARPLLKDVPDSDKRSSWVQLENTFKRMEYHEERLRRFAQELSAKESIEMREDRETENRSGSGQPVSRQGDRAGATPTVQGDNMLEIYSEGEGGVALEGNAGVNISEGGVLAPNDGNSEEQVEYNPERQRQASEAEERVREQMEEERDREEREREDEGRQKAPWRHDGTCPPS